MWVRFIDAPALDQLAPAHREFRHAIGALAMAIALGCGGRTGLTEPQPDAGSVERRDARTELPEVDLLYVMDPSISVSGSRGVLGGGITGIIDALDRASSLRLGVITTDLGSGGFPVFGCPEPLRGDDALLLRASECPDWGARHHVSDERVGRLSQAWTCLVDSRPVTCGFEQPLEATLRALSPAGPTDWTSSRYTPPELLHGAPLHGDGANAGFLRPDSILVIFYASEEDDCSAVDPRLFDPSSPTYSPVDLNLRCAAFAETALVSIDERYPAALLRLRRDPRRLVVVLVTGVSPTDAPSDREPEWESVVERLGGVPLGERLCGGAALPAPRLVTLGAALAAEGAQVVLESYCRLADLGPLSSRILHAVDEANATRD